MATTSAAGPSKARSLLQQVEIASPCHASWEEMVGDDRVRFCLECNRDVFNLSALTQQQAEALLLQSGHSLCVRLYRRTDGTYLTADCPNALQRAHAWVKHAAAAAVALALGVLGWSVARPAARCDAPPELEGNDGDRDWAVRQSVPPAAPPGAIGVRNDSYRAVMGAVVMPMRAVASPPVRRQTVVPSTHDRAPFRAVGPTRQD